MAQPLYRQIAEDLRERIESGQIARGSMLPSELELRENYEASRNTVRDALRWLTTRGLVETRNGQGTFVSREINPFITTLSWQEAVHYADRAAEAGPEAVKAGPEKVTASGIRLEIQRASGALAEMLRLPEGTEIISRQLMRRVDGTPWCLQTIYYPRELVAREAELTLWDGDDRYHDYPHKDICGLLAEGCRDRISVAPPNRNEVELFRLPDDGRVSVITVQRTHYAHGDRGPFPFRVTVTAYPADRNQLLVDIGNVTDPV
jgi:GntR family transcriptional regulator